MNEGAFDRDELVAELERQMLEAAERLEFERAAGFRDRLERVRGLPDSAGLASLVKEDGDAPVRRKAGMPGTRGRRSKGGR